MSTDLNRGGKFRTWITVNWIPIIIGLVSIAVAFMQLFLDHLPYRSLFTLIDAEIVTIAVGATGIVGGLILIYGTLWAPLSHLAMRVGSFLASVCFMFLTAVAYLDPKVNDVYALTTLALAVISGILHIKLGRKDAI